MNKKILIMTATITPPKNIQNLKRINPETRLNDYLNALNFYFSSTTTSVIDKILFIENSNSDLSKLQEFTKKAGKEDYVEFVSFSGLDYPMEYGIAYGEFKLLDIGLSMSNIITQLSSTDILWKITGRYKLINLVKLIESAPTQYSLYCDLKRFPGYWMDLRVWSSTVNGYDRILRGIYSELREDKIKKSAEVFAFSHVINVMQKEKIIPRFKVQPYIDGYSAYGNFHYLQGKKGITFFLRTFIRKLIPSLWI